MEFLIENWFIIVAVAALLGVAAFAFRRFIQMPSGEQLQKVREWLLYAVTEAEREFGGGTGQLKLRNVYDLFIQRFPWLVKVISFATFSGLVDDALEEMRNMLKKNNTIKALVEDKNA